MNPAALLVAVALFNFGADTSVGSHISVKSQAIVIETRSSQPTIPPTTDGSTILVYTARDCGFKRTDYRAHTHSVHTKGVLAAALRKLLKTMRDPKDPPARALLKRVELEDGVARIDFRSFTDTSLARTATSCGGTGLLGPLNNTVFQFRSIRAARYLFDGSCSAFHSFMQSVCKQGHGTLTRSEWKDSPVAINR